VPELIHIVLTGYNLNQRGVLAYRVEEVAKLYTENCVEEVILI